MAKQASAKKPFLGRDTKTSVINKCVKAFFDYYDAQKAKLSPEEIERKLTTELNDEIIAHNNLVPTDKWSRVDKLPSDVVAEVINHCEIVRNISLTQDVNSDTSLVGIYQTKGDAEGTYITSDRELRNLVRSYTRYKNPQDIRDVLTHLKDMAQPACISRKPHLTAVKNGIYNRLTGSLEPFSPEYVFLNKIGTAYNPNATNPTIQMPDGVMWDCEWQLDSFSDDEGLRKLFRDILTAAVYPYYKWDKAFFPYSPQGNNGKGTYCSLLRNMLGDSGWVSIPIKDFAKDFLCSPLIGSNAVIVDENDVSTFVDSAENFKCCVTQDPFMLNRKYKEPVTILWMGFMFQCVNDYPRFRDRTDSMLRRIAIVPFEKSFKGVERKYIREDYLRREDVREYYLKIALENDITEIELPDACEVALNRYKASNNPLYEFYINEVCEYSAWTFYPLNFVYEHYKAWFAKNYPTGRALSKNSFKQDLMAIVLNDDETPVVEIGIEENPKRVPDKAMAGAEPAIIEYNLEQYMNTSYHGSDIEKRTNFKRQKMYRGGYMTFNKRPSGAVNDDEESDVS